MIPLMERKLLLICVGVEGVLLKIAMVPDISELTRRDHQPPPQLFKTMLWKQGSC